MKILKHHTKDCIVHSHNAPCVQLLVSFHLSQPLSSHDLWHKPHNAAIPFSYNTPLCNGNVHIYKIIHCEMHCDALCRVWHSFNMWPVNQRNRADSRFVPSQWEKELLCSDVSHWLGAIPGSALIYATELGLFLYPLWCCCLFQCHIKI